SFWGTIERYLFGRILAAMALVLLALDGILWIVWAARGDAFFAAGAAPALEFLGLTFLTLPLITAVLLPFALLIGGLQAFASLNRDAELVIADAAGLPRSRIWKPVLALSILTFIASGMLSIWLGPASMRTFEQQTQNASVDLIFSIFQKGEFRQLTDGLTVHVGTLEDRETLGEIFISDERDPTTHFIYYARRGAVVKRDGAAYLALADGEIHRIPMGGRDDAGVGSSIVEFESYAFDFTSLLATQRVRGFALNARYISELFNRDLNDPLFRDTNAQVRRELLDRFSAPFWAVTFGAAALFFAARPSTGRQGRFANGFAAFLLCGAARAGGWASLAIANLHPALYPLPFLFPLALAGFFFFGFLRPHAFELPRWLADPWDRLRDVMAAKWTSLLARISGRAPVEAL
ncbi:MAG: LptF/LptG family permease, partial [Pseudomonadota bacterium]